MRKGRRLPELKLSEEHRSTLQGWTRRRKTAQALSMRAQIVLRASDGLTPPPLPQRCMPAFKRSVNGGTGLMNRDWTVCSMSHVPGSHAS